MELYLVIYVRHNKSTGGMAYKVDFASPSLSEAKKKYHAICGEYFDSVDFDFVSVVLIDAFGNKIAGDYDSNIIPPSPEVEE